MSNARTFSLSAWAAVAVMTALLVGAVPATAQKADLDALFEKIESSETVDQYQRFRDVLNGLDPNKRLVAFEVMIESDVPALREIALEEGLASSDQVLRALAGQTALLLRDTLAIKLIRPDGDDFEARPNAWKRFGGVYNISLVDKKPGGVKQDVKDYYSGGELSLSGELLQMSWTDYQRSFELRLMDGQYEGEFLYPVYFTKPLKAVLTLR